MGVLPDRSKKIVPAVYHELMTSPDSPIIDFYPRDFELDMNGKKMDWEAVVKIPFIDQHRLLSAMRPKDELLSDQEKNRNEFGVSLKFTYSPDIEFTYPSSLIGIFPDISRCHCVENIFDLPTMDGIDYHIGLMPGVKLGASALAGFPSLKTLPFTGALGFHSVNVFQQDSRNESMIITLMDSESRSKSSFAKSLLGQQIHVGYPFLSEAKVTRVSDELFSYSLPQGDKAPPLAVPHGPQELDLWHRKAKRIEAVYSKRLGVIIGGVDALVHVDTLKGLKKTDDGATVKEFAHVHGTETDYAAQTVVDQVISQDERFVERAALPVEEEFPLGSRAFFLGDFNYGRALEVIGHTDKKIDIKVSTVAARIPEFGRQIVIGAQRTTPYSPSFAVAKVLGLNPLVLSKLTSSFQVTLDEIAKVNLGLNLKFEAKKQKVLGYSKRGPSGWEFSEKAIQLIRLYMIKFPLFIASIQRNPQGSIVRATDIWPPSEAKAKVKEIQAWLKEIESKSFEPVPLDAEQLDSDTVQKIEHAANGAAQLDSNDKAKVRKIVGAPRSAILKPADAEQRLSNQNFQLGDRIVYVQDSGKVPIAARGTVIGKSRTARAMLLDIVFDIEFISGTSLGERCSPFRGQTVPAHAVLNLTDRQVIAGSRATDNQRPQPPVKPLTVTGYGAPTGPNGQGQLIPAQAPPPLRGSFRGAVSGPQATRSRGSSPRARGGLGYPTTQSPQQQLPIRTATSQQNGPVRSRGRGAAPHVNGVGNHPRGAGKGTQTNRAGYTTIDKGDMTGVIQNNPAFKPTPYNSAPPPPSLDSRGHGRGRGGARGDSTRGRARGVRSGGGTSRGASSVTVQQG